jgi:multidrug efflux pump subunit AcrA (membrane-fusion protein)
MNAATRIFGGLMVMLVAGCGASQAQSPQTKAPRPVSVMTLRVTQPHHGQTMTGSVGSWKTEEVGFEVDGRVKQVLEPGAEIEGRILDGTDQTVITEGTVLARLDDERFRIAAAAAEAAIGVATRRMEALRVDIEQGTPAQIARAEAEQELAKLEFDRASNLVSEEAISRKEVDRTQATYKTASAEVETRKAELAGKQAELLAIAAQVKQAELQLAEAERDRRDATLYSSFRGQVAQIHVVPGSYVKAGEPVLTIQMMDPIKVELELSATMSRKFLYGDTVRLFGTSADGQPIPLTGFVYMTDPVADPNTRTFSVTLLVRNQRIDPAIELDSSGEQLPRTKDIWPLKTAPIVGGGGALMVEKNAIRRDSQGAFLWRVTNRQIGEVTPRDARVLDVTKLRVTPGRQVIPFLGTWDFVPISIDEGETCDPDHDLVAGDITLEGGDADSWDGNRILLHRSDWLLRPGDLVRVDLPNGEATSGYYVPVRAIRHESGRTFVFVVHEPEPGRFRARRVEVQLDDTAYSSSDDNVLRRIDPVEHGALAVGSRLIVDGVHFLADGESVAIVSHSESVR